MPQADMDSFRGYLLEQAQKQGWTPGNRLPSVRELADQLGYDKNTILKLYHRLAQEGLVHVLPARGVFFAGPVGYRNSSLQAILREAFKRAAAQGRLSAIPIEATRKIAQDAIQEAYNDAPLRIAFVECNSHDAQSTGAELEGYLGQRVAKKLLEDVARNGDYLAEHFDFFVTTFFHLSELEQLLRLPDRIIGINLVPDHASVEEIARIPPDTRVAVISLTAVTLERMLSITRTYTKAQLIPCVANDPSLPQILNSVTYTIDTLGSHERVLSCTTTAQVITLRFKVDPKSIEYLHDKMDAAQSLHLADGLPRDGGQR